MLAFGSSAEASARPEHFATEACRWESLARSRISDIAPDAQLTEAGRFQLSRRGRLVFLDVAIDPRRYKQLLATHCDRDAWDWARRNRRSGPNSWHFSP